ncbi:hypothetical protein R3P38DRAFT_2827766 [Favolaschia claudopus]|uniref:F-box domain-containing protein n=1 Tax=Favolaschia claudopus TaxID=2862362 RepID=A0AAW0EI08_9AGAR
MPVQSKLLSIPADIHYLLLSILPDFRDLAALILTHRCFYGVFKTGEKTLLEAVARNFLGAFYDEAVALAYEKRPSHRRRKRRSTPLTSKIARSIKRSNHVLESLERIVYGLLKTDKHLYLQDPYNYIGEKTLGENFAELASFTFTAIPSFEESLKMTAAGYRIWRFTLLHETEHVPFLMKLPLSELLELNHYVSGLVKLIWAMLGEGGSHHDADYVQGVLATGPWNILRRWNALLEGDMEEFYEGPYGEHYEGFFTSALFEVMDRKQLGSTDLYAYKSIFDGDKETRELLRNLAAKENGVDVETDA